MTRMVPNKFQAVPAPNKYNKPDTHTNTHTHKCSTSGKKPGRMV